MGRTGVGKGKGAQQRHVRTLEGQSCGAMFFQVQLPQILATWRSTPCRTNPTHLRRLAVRTYVCLIKNIPCTASRGKGYVVLPHRTQDAASLDYLPQLVNFFRHKRDGVSPRTAEIPVFKAEHGKRVHRVTEATSVVWRLAIVWRNRARKRRTTYDGGAWLGTQKT